MFDDKETEQLIQAIEERPPIWNMRSEDYGNREKKKQAWEEVTLIFVDESASTQEKKETGKLLHAKWKNIRNRYSKERKSMTNTKSGSGSKKKIPYLYTRQLAFLNDVIEFKSTASSLDCTFLERPQENEEANELNSVEPASVGSRDTETTSTSYEPTKRVKSTSYQEKPFSTKKRLDQIELKLVQASKANISAKENERKSDDDDLHFLLSLLPTMKNLPQHLKLATRIELMQVLIKNSSPQRTYAQPHMQQPQHSQPHVSLPTCDQ